MQGDIVSSVLLPLILGFIMFSLGLGLTPGDFRRILAQPRALLVGVVCHFVLLPLACYGLLTAVGMGGVFAVGFMILAACPTGSTSNLLTYLARGDVALAVSFTAVASVLTIFTLPLVVTWSLGHFLGAARAVDVPVGQMMGQVALVLGLPVSAGMWVRHRWGLGAALRTARHARGHGAVRAHRGAGRGQKLGAAARQLHHAGAVCVAAQHQHAVRGLWRGVGRAPVAQPVGHPGH